MKHNDMLQTKDGMKLDDSIDDVVKWKKNWIHQESDKMPMIYVILWH